MFKFDKPLTTKSGDDVVETWNKLEESWAIYKQARMESDFKTMQIQAQKIQLFQNDLGITQATFPELKIEKI